MAQYDIDLRDYWRVLKKRRALVILTVLLMGLFSYVFAKSREPIPVYQATASVKIEKVSSIAGLLEGFVSWSSGDTITTQSHIIGSFPVMVQSAKDLKWLPKNLSPETIRNSKKYLSVIEQLRSMIETKAEPGASIINILVTSKKSQEAAKVANTVANAYHNFNILERNRQTLEMRGFIENQLSLTSQRLDRAEEKLRAFKEEHDLISPEAKASQIFNRLNDLETDYEKVKREIDKLSSQLSIVQSGRITPQSLAQAVLSADPDSPLRRLSPALSELSIKRATLLVAFTEEHPQVKEIDGQIEGLLKELRTEVNSYVETLELRKEGLSLTIKQLRERNQSIPERALRLSRLEREVSLYETLYAELKRKHQEVLIQESGKIEEVTIIRPAMVPTVPVNTRSNVTTAVTGIIIGVILGIVLAFISETLDTSIGAIEDVESFLQVPVLGLIPSLEVAGKEKKKDHLEDGAAREWSGLVAHFEPKSIIAEAYRSLRTNLQFIDVEKRKKSFMITSSSLQEGKTFSVVNLAVCMAQAGDKVLLVEGDLRKPKVYKIFGINRVPGVTDYVLGNYEWHEVVNTISDVMLGEIDIEDLLRTPGLDNLSIVTAGTRPPNPSEIVSSPRFSEFLQAAKRQYDVVLLDAPPVLPVADATEIGTRVDGVILVYEVGRVARGVLKRAKITLDNVNANILGVVLSNVKPDVSPDVSDYYYRSYYGYGYREKDDEERSEKRMKAGFAISRLAKSLFRKKILS